MFGKINFAEFKACALEQGAATAWSAFESLKLVGASYKPLLFVGTNYIFIAEQKIIVEPLIRRVVKFVINFRNGEAKLAAVEEV